MPVTSRQRDLKRAAQTDLIRALRSSFVATATWDGATRYRIHVGYDAGDPFYDRRPVQRALAAAFGRLVGDRPATLVAER